MSEPKVFHNIFPGNLEELAWVSQKIRSLLDQGTPAQEIAVIARKHASLQEAVTIFHRLQIPINYERDENVLEKPFIQQIITILKFIHSLNKADTGEFQELLPEILSYPFWQIPNLAIYQISLDSAKNKQTWLETMTKSENIEIQKIADFLRELAKLSVSCTAEQILDEILGVTREIKLPEQENEDNDQTSYKNYSYDPEKGILNIVELTEIDKKKCITRYISPYKWYYFDSNFSQSKSEYFTFLSSLRVFFTAIREYKKKQIIATGDVLEFVELMKSNNLPLNDKSSFNQQKDTVCLLTAHKSKGLEFEYVFVINCLEKEWNGAKTVNKINLPSNLKLMPEGENTDDSLRLLFVALTRAKKYLYLTSHEQNISGKELEKLGFMEGVDLLSDLKNTDFQESAQVLKIWLNSTVQTRDLSLNEKDYLKAVLENYKLSVTHLNNFLDLSQGGPRLFLEQNLLKFPQSKTPSSSYGTAIHATLAGFYNSFKETGILPTSEKMLDLYQYYLQNERMSKDDYQKYLDKGKENLSRYFEFKKQNFDPSDIIERDFSSQSVIIGNAKITGKIDKIKISKPNELLVIDLKTGKSFEVWKASDAHAKVKLDRYHRQLVFYKVLVENSRDFGGQYKVNEGSLEFVETNRNDQKITSLEAQISDLEADNLMKLIQVVFRKIQNFEFDLAKNYTADLAGTQEFIQDLLAEF